MMVRVLVVDDEPQVRSAVERALRRAGYEVLCASSGDSAYGILSDAQVDAILLDLLMPQMGGDALFLAFVRRWPYLIGRVILMSGHPDLDREHWPPELHACPVLEKPFRLEELYRVLEEVIGGTEDLRRSGNE